MFDRQAMSNGPILFAFGLSLYVLSSRFPFRFVDGEGWVLKQDGGIYQSSGGSEG